MSEHDRDLHACVLAALILHDGGVVITGPTIKAVLDASNNGDVPLVYCNMIAKFSAGNNMSALLLRTRVQRAGQQQQVGRLPTGVGELAAGSSDDSAIDVEFCGGSTKDDDDDDDDDLFGVSLFD